MARASDLTPDEAAAIIGVPPDADPAEVERAYRRLARELHPDRFAGRPVDEATAAAARFVEIARAHEVLLAAAADRRAATSDTAAQRLSSDDRVASGRPLPPFSWWLFGTWTFLLVIGGVLSTTTGAIVTPLDLWGRLGLLIAFAMATALTRRRWVWWTTLALLFLSGAAVIVSTTVAGLLGLGVMAIASVGLAVQAGLVRFPDQ